MSAPTVARGPEGVSPAPPADPSAEARANVAEANRYPGSPPFGDTAIDRLLFRGRARETDEVLHSVLSYDLFLVYAVSGMGKTSLLTAGVLEPLRQRGYFPVMLRVNSPDTPMLALIESQIREAAALAGVDIDRTPTIPDDAPPSTTLWDLLAELEIWRGNTLQQLVLVFDQFEELFTLPWSQDARAEFIEQFGEVVRHHRVPGRDPDPARQALPPPNVKIVLCMREDFIGQLEALAVSVPQILQRRFRLGALDPEQAEAAIREPAALEDPRLRTQQFSYSPGAATAILTFLRTKDERGATILTESIDPSQLQIICQYIERSILPAKQPGPDGLVEITESDLGGPEGLRRIVGDFYRHVLETFDARTRKLLRHLCETGLISQSGRRLSLEEGEIAGHFDVSRDVLRELVDLRLLRSEPRVGSVYYELAHDTLTVPILAYRDARRRERRRRLAIALLVVAGLSALVVVLIVASRRSEHPAAGPAPPIALTIGEEKTAELSSADDTAAYEVTTGDQPLIVEFRPAGFNGALVVTSSGADGTTQTQDVGLLGAPEFAVLPPDSGQYRIQVSGAGPGEYSLVARPASPRPLTIPSKPRTFQLDSTGEPTVFAIEGSGDQALAVSITAANESGSKDTKEINVAARGVFMQITAPDGATSQSRADGSSKDLSVVGAGDAGTYLLAIGDSSGGTKSSYELSAEPVRITPTPIGGSADAHLAGSALQTVFEVHSPEGGPLFFELSDTQGVSIGEVQTPDGGAVDLDSTTFAVVSGGPGRYLAFVSSEVPDNISLAVSSARGDVIDVGQSISGQLDDEHRVALYRVRSSTDVPLVAEVTSDESLDAMLSLASTGELAVDTVDFAGPDATEQLVLPTGVDDTQLFAVTPFEQTSGSFTFAVRPADVRAIGIGETVTRHLDVGELALYTVDAEADDPFGVSVTSPDSQQVNLSVTDPSGEEFSQDDNLFVSTSGAGKYTIAVRSVDEAGDFAISVDSPHALPSDAAGPATGAITAPGDVELLQLPFADDASTFVTITTDGAVEVAATVTDAFGNVLVYPDEPIDATGTIIVPAGSGSDWVFVNGTSGSGTIQVEARNGTPTALDIGTQQTFAVDRPGDAAVFSVGPSDGLLGVTVQPSDDVVVDVTVTDSLGNVWDTESADATSPDTLYPDTRDGPVQIVVVATAGHGTVTTRSNEIETTSLEVGQVRRGSISAPRQALAFDVDVEVPLELQAVVTPASGFDVQISALDPYGEFSFVDGFEQGDAETVPFVSGPGIYRVIVSGAGDSTGAFQITVEPNREQTDDVLREAAENLQS